MADEKAAATPAAAEQVVFSPYPNSIKDSSKHIPTDQELEDVRQAALLYVRPAGDDGPVIHIATILTMTLQGFTETAIAEKTGCSRGQVRVARRMLREKKLLNDALQESADRLANEAVPLAVDNVIAKLENADEKATYRVLDTFGLGPQKGVAPGGTNAPLVPAIPVLNLNFTLPPGVTVMQANKFPESGKIIGRGKDAGALVKAAPDEPAIDLPPDHVTRHG